MRWLIIGGDSTIGNSLSHAWSLQGRNFHSTTRNKFRVSKVRPYLDLGIDETSICSKDYDGAVLCIGESRVSYCEEHPRESSLINVQHTVELANALTKAGTYVLFLSSSRVFNGQTRSNPVGKIPNPTTEYGRQKVEAEKQILDLEGSGILRLTKVLDSGSEPIKSWRESLTAEQAIYPFSNVFVAPISNEAVAEKVTQILEKKSAGIQHLSSTNLVSFFDLAMALCSEWNLDSSLIVPRVAPDSPLYPRYSSLA